MRRPAIALLLLGTAALGSGPAAEAQDAPTPAPKPVVPPPRDVGSEVQHVAVSSDGLRIAASGHAGDVLVWDVASGKPVKLEPCAGKVESLAFADGGKVVVAGCSRKQVEGSVIETLMAEVWGRGTRCVVAWDAAEGKLLQRWPREGESVEADLVGIFPLVGGIAVSYEHAPGLRLPLSYPEEPRMVDPVTGAAVPGRLLPATARSAATTADGLLLVSEDREYRVVRVVLRESGKELWTSPALDPKAKPRTRTLWSGAWIHEGAQTVVRTGRILAGNEVYSSDTFVAAFELDTGAELWRVVADAHDLVLPTGNFPELIVHDAKGFQYLDGRTGRNLRTLARPDEKVWAMALPPDGRTYWRARGHEGTLTNALLPPRAK